MIKKIFEFDDVLFKEDDIKDLVELVKKHDENNDSSITYENPNKEFIELSLNDKKVFQHLDFTKLVSVSIRLSPFLHETVFQIKIENNSDNSYIEISTNDEDNYNSIKKDIEDYIRGLKRQNFIQKFDPSNLFFAITKFIGSTIMYFSVLSFILIAIVVVVNKNISDTALLILIGLMIFPAFLVTVLIQRSNNKNHFVNSKIVEKRKKAWMFILVHILIPTIVTIIVSIAIVKLI